MRFAQRLICRRRSLRRRGTPPLRIRFQHIEMKHNDIAVGNYRESLEQIGGKLKIVNRELMAGMAVDMAKGSTDYYVKWGM